MKEETKIKVGGEKWKCGGCSKVNKNKKRLLINNEKEAK